MTRPPARRLRCAIYTRVSTDAGLEQDFNSLDAQREAAEAYIKSQAHEGWQVIRTHYDDGGFSGGTMDRPALQQLRADIRAGCIDVVVVYKVDRLTRSLADFAKLVELFDSHSVSFVSVTQAFNTTSSMGRLTLNVLLSFAQFEREVTGERIRDKIAASKKRGLWMGGTVPLGYKSRNKKLVIVEDEAERVRFIFRRYLELGSLDLLMKDLRARGTFTKVRCLSNGRTIGGIPFTRGPLAYLLRNCSYIGEVVYRGSTASGEHEPIIDRALFEAVQEKLACQRRRSGTSRTRAAALLTGRLYDDRDNRMTPSHASKSGVRYRYYVSCALLQGRGEEAGSVRRISAPEIETTILRILRDRWPEESDDRALIARHLDRAVIFPAAIEVSLRTADPGRESSAGDDRRCGVTLECDGGPAGPDADHTKSIADVITIAWSPPCVSRRREILVPSRSTLDDARPIRSERRATLVRAVALGRRWLSEIVDGSVTGLDAIAARENCSKRHVAMTISLAFLSPELVKAAVEGRLPRGIGLRNLADPPLGWLRQHHTVGV